jgi:hypothetical protein
MTLLWSEWKEKQGSPRECRGGPWDGAYVVGRTVESAQAALITQYGHFYAFCYSAEHTDGEGYWLWHAVPEYTRMEGP